MKKDIKLYTEKTSPNYFKSINDTHKYAEVYGIKGIQVLDKIGNVITNNITLENVVVNNTNNIIDNNINLAKSDTVKLQYLINNLSEDNTLVFEKNKIYTLEINPETKAALNIINKHNINLDLNSCILRVISNDLDEYAVFNIFNSSNINISNGIIIGDRVSHEYYMHLDINNNYVTASKVKETITREYIVTPANRKSKINHEEILGLTLGQNNNGYYIVSIKNTDVTLINKIWDEETKYKEEKYLYTYEIERLVLSEHEKCDCINIINSSNITLNKLEIKQFPGSGVNVFSKPYSDNGITLVNDSGNEDSSNLSNVFSLKFGTLNITQGTFIPYSSDKNNIGLVTENYISVDLLKTFINESIENNYDINSNVNIHFKPLTKPNSLDKDRKIYIYCYNENLMLIEKISKLSFYKDNTLFNLSSLHHKTKYIKIHIQVLENDTTLAFSNTAENVPVLKIIFGSSICNSINIKDCNISYCRKNGIYLSGCRNISISNSEIRNLGSIALGTNHEETIVSNNKIQKTLIVGGLVESYGVIFSEDYDINLNGHLTNINIHDCNITMKVDGIDKSIIYNISNN